MNMSKFVRRSVWIALLALFWAAPVLAAQPKYVFYFIGDGLGASQRQVSEFFLREKTGDHTAKMRMNAFEVAGLNTTYCANTLITDSAAAGTALASGVKTNKGFIGKDVDGKDVRTLVEAARDKGMQTGLITTTRLTHATPAAFAAHNVSRNNENEIAEDYLKSNVAFLAGGGIRHFIPGSMKIERGDAVGKTIESRRNDEQNLIKAFAAKGYATFIGMPGANAFNRTDFSKHDKVFAAFTASHMPYDIERKNLYPDVPSLAAMTRAGIAVLQKAPKGFFLMVEGGRIDHACHANDAAAAIHGTLALDAAVQAAFDFYKTHRTDTLIVVTGDHETGGLGLGMDRLGYQLNMAALMTVNSSVEDTLNGKSRYKGDRSAYRALLASKFGLTSLSAAENAKLEKAFAAADAGQTAGYYKMNPAALAAAHLLSERANINWTATIHTATMIPLSATGAGAQAFGGYKDNTEIARIMAALLGLRL